MNKTKAKLHGLLSSFPVYYLHKQDEPEETVVLATSSHLVQIMESEEWHAAQHIVFWI